MTGRILVVLVLGLAMVLSAVACGDDDEATDSLTKAEWIEAADEICIELDQELAEIPEPESPEEMGETGLEVVAITAAKFEELRALEPPEGEEEAVAEILDAFDLVAETGGEFTQVAAETDWPEEQSAEAEALFMDLEEATVNAEQLSASYGLQECFASE